MAHARVRHRDQPVQSSTLVKPKSPEKRRLSLNRMLPRDGGHEWVTVPVEWLGGDIRQLPDIKRCYEDRISNAFYSTYPKVTPKLFDYEMGRVIWEAAVLDGDDEEEEFRFLYSPPLEYWAKVIERLEGTNSFAENWAITPATLVAFVAYAMDSFVGDNGRCRSLYGPLKNAMERLMYIYEQRLHHDYDGPDEPYVERERRVVVNGRDVDLDYLVEMKGEEDRRVYKSAEFVLPEDDKTDSEDEPEHAEDRYNMDDLRAALPEDSGSTIWEFAIMAESLANSSP